MSRDDILLEAEMSMEKSVDYMVHEFAAVRTSKASPGLVENVDVPAYGSTMKLKQLALITKPWLLAPATRDNRCWGCPSP